MGNNNNRSDRESSVFIIAALGMILILMMCWISINFISKDHWVYHISGVFGLLLCIILAGVVIKSFFKL